jgi:hypothetical protein
MLINCTNKVHAVGHCDVANCNSKMKLVISSCFVTQHPSSPKIHELAGQCLEGLKVSNISFGHSIRMYSHEIEE